MVGDVVIGIVSGAAGFLGAALWEIGPPESSQPSVREADRTVLSNSGRSLPKPGPLI